MSVDWSKELLFSTAEVLVKYDEDSLRMLRYLVPKCNSKTIGVLNKYLIVGGANCSETLDMKQNIVYPSALTIYDIDKGCYENLRNRAYRTSKKNYLTRKVNHKSYISSLKLLTNDKICAYLLYRNKETFEDVLNSIAKRLNSFVPADFIDTKLAERIYGNSYIIGKVYLKAIQERYRNGEYLSNTEFSIIKDKVEYIHYYKKKYVTYLESEEILDRFCRNFTTFFKLILCLISRRSILSIVLLIKHLKIYVLIISLLFMVDVI